MKDLIHSAIKKVTLELIYEVVDERTKELNGKVEHLEHEMNRRFEAMDQKFTALNARIDQLFAIIVSQRKNSK